MATYDLFRKYKSLYSATANSFGTGDAETITPSSVVGLPTDTDITLTFDRGVAGKVERIIGAISGGNFVSNVTPSGRGKDNTTDQAHTSPVVEMIWNSVDWNDAIDGILVAHDQAGVHKSGATYAAPVFSGTITGTYTIGGTPTFPAAVTTLTGTQTLTNKRVTQRVTTTTDDASSVINIDNCDVYELTAVANATTFTTTGTPTDGQKLIIRLKDAGVTKDLTWTDFTAIGVTLPAATTASKWHYIGCVYNLAATAWHAIAVGEEA